MILEHVAIWTSQLEKMKDFYVKYFGAVPNEKYVSDKEFKAHFESYFLSFDSTARLELMQMSIIPQGDNANGFESSGLTHIAISAKERSEVDEAAAKLKNDGITLMLEPHQTGDGYYEACVLDPDGNRVEIVVLPD
jgi:lactoylglutathione lyase